MTRITGFLLAVGSAACSVLGGTIAFDPPVATVASGETAQFRVTIASTGLTNFDSIDLLFSSDREGLNLSFVYDPSFSTSLAPSEPVSASAFPSDLFVGGVNFNLWQAPVVVGTLRIDTTGLAPGTYDDIVAVRPEEEAQTPFGLISAIGLGSVVEAEGVSGAADLVVSAGPVTDTDGDGTGDNVDAFPHDPTETIDTDDDGVGDNSDADDDNDGVEDADDAFPSNPDENLDTDGDGTGDNADTDDDDGIADLDDAFPLDPNDITDSDGDGIGDNTDADGSNADTGPRVGVGFCGLGMVGSTFFMLLGITTIRLSRRRSRRCC